jgi:hypothetical protein
MLSNVVNSLALLISLSTTAGILMHDNHLDTIATAAFSLPSMVPNYEATGRIINFGNELHTHAEQTSLSQSLQEISAQNPRIQPRTDDKKHLLQKRVMRGYHPFDNYSLPLA